jgi:hypothetical protein
MVKEDMIKKINPASRKDIHVATLNKVKKFLEEQIVPVFKSEIIKNCGIDANSLNIALIMLNAKIEKDGKVSINRRKK